MIMRARGIRISDNPGRARIIIDNLSPSGDRLSHVLAVGNLDARAPSAFGSFWFMTIERANF
jgi:hypothetical protein